MIDFSAIYDEGWDAYFDGDDEDCPYDSVEESDAWISGYLDAQADDAIFVPVVRGA
jgi:ribosome modulation factor